MLRRRIQDLINDLQHIPVARDAVRELMIFESKLGIQTQVTSYIINETNDTDRPGHHDGPRL